jgi:hypothetical protein
MSFHEQRSTSGRPKNWEFLSFVGWSVAYFASATIKEKKFDVIQRVEGDWGEGQSCIEGWPTAEPNCKNPPKTKFWKLVKLADHTSTSNNLTSFVYKTHLPETEIVVNLLKFALKNSWNHMKRTYFVAGFNYLELLCGLPWTMVATAAAGSCEKDFGDLRKAVKLAHEQRRVRGKQWQPCKAA